MLQGRLKSPFLTHYAQVVLKLSLSSIGLAQNDSVMQLNRVAHDLNAICVYVTMVLWFFSPLLTDLQKHIQ